MNFPQLWTFLLFLAGTTIMGAGPTSYGWCMAGRTNLRAQVFDSEGKFLHQWKTPELGRR